MTREKILAMEPGRELDDLVAKRVMGAVPWGPFEPSTDISAAMEVVDKIQEKAVDAKIERKYCIAEMKWFAVFSFEDHYVSVSAFSAPEAICKAALIAVTE